MILLTCNPSRDITSTPSIYNGPLGNFLMVQWGLGISTDLIYVVPSTQVRASSNLEVVWVVVTSTQVWSSNLAMTRNLAIMVFTYWSADVLKYIYVTYFMTLCIHIYIYVCMIHGQQGWMVEGSIPSGSNAQAYPRDMHSAMIWTRKDRFQKLGRERMWRIIVLYE